MIKPLVPSKTSAPIKARQRPDETTDEDPGHAAARLAARRNDPWAPGEVFRLALHDVSRMLSL